MAEPEDADWLATRSALVEAVRTGLMSGQEVMAQLGITSGMLGGWCRAEQVRRAKGEVGGGGARAPALTRVALVGSPRQAAAGVVALRGGRRLRVPAGFDEAEVKRLVRLLESC